MSVFPDCRTNSKLKTGRWGYVCYLTALSVIAPYPAPCGAAAPTVPAARYCKRSFGFARLLSLPFQRKIPPVERFPLGGQFGILRQGGLADQQKQGPGRKPVTLALRPRSGPRLRRPPVLDGRYWQEQNVFRLV